MCLHLLKNTVYSAYYSGAHGPHLFIVMRPWRYLNFFIFHYLFPFLYLLICLSLFYFISTKLHCILSSSPDPIHFVLLYILRYYCCTRVFILYTRVCIPVLLVMSSIVYNLHHIMSYTLSFYFLRSSYRPAQSRNMGVFVIFVILIMSFNVFVSAISTPTSWLVLVLINIDPMNNS